MAEENIIKFKIKTEDNALRSTKNQIKELKAAMLDAEDTATFNKLALEAGRLETEVKRTEDAVRSLAGSGSELTKMSTSFSRVGSSLVSMDFAAAAEEAGRLAAISKSMNFGTAISSLKSLGSTFMSLGKALLTNPFFLLVGVVVAIGVALYKLMDELGIITAIFEAVGDAIGWVIQQLKDLLDWFGLTSYAADEEAEREKKRQADIEAARTAAFNQLVTEKEQEIAMMKASGASIDEIEDAEISLAQTRFEASKARLQQEEAAQQAIINQLKAWGQLAAATELQIKLDNQRNEVKTLEIDLINTISRVDDAREQRGKVNAEAAKKREEDKKKIQEDIANAQLKADEMIAKAKIEFIEDEIERARQMAIFNEEQSFKSIDLKILTDSQKETLEQQHQQRLIDIEKEAIDKRIEIQKKAREEELKEKKIKEDLYLETLMASITKQKALEDEKAEYKSAVEQGSLDLAQGVLGALSANMQEGSNAAKGIAVGQATMDTFRGAQAAFASTAANPISIAFPAAPFIAAASAVAMGVANVRKILATKSDGSGGAPSATTMTPPSFGGRQDGNQSTPSMNLNNGVEQNAGGSVNRVTVVDYTDIQDKGTQLNKLQNRVSLV